MEIIDLLDAGVTGLLTAAVIALWKDNQKSREFLQAIIRGQMDIGDEQSRAARERQKIGAAVGLHSLDDTEGRRPHGLDARLSHLKNDGSDTVKRK